MGYGSYVDKDGRLAGYNIVATCDHPDCEASIDRGLAYRCGGQSEVFEERGCGKFFCPNHLTGGTSLCPECRCVILGEEIVEEDTEVDTCLGTVSVYLTEDDSYEWVLRVEAGKHHVLVGALEFFGSFREACRNADSVLQALKLKAQA